MIYFLLALTVVSALTCPKYSCHQGGFDLGETCAYQTKTGDVKMQICEASPLSPVCNVNPSITKNFTCGARVQKPYENLLPGQFCYLGTQCLSGNCLNNKCAGLSFGALCQNHEQCNVGYYCAPSGKCYAQQSQFQSCNSDYECQNQFACNRTLYNPGTCIPYYSVANGEGIGMCVTGFSEGQSNLCQSGACTQINPNHNGEGTCVPAFRSDKPYPLSCNADTDCTAHNSAGTGAVGTCNCGMDKNGLAYCNAWTGDPPALTTRALISQHISQPGITNCHTMLRFTSFCYQQTLVPAQVLNLTQNTLLAGDTPRYQNNDYCTQTIYNADYWRVSASDFTCKAYGCRDDLQWNFDSCMTYLEGSNEFAIKTCPKGDYCNYVQIQGNQWNNVTCTVPPNAAPLYPGELCTTGSQCISGTCLSGKCRGTFLGQQCHDSSECQVGSYCYSVNLVFICVPLIPIGSDQCGTEYDCVPQAGCNATRNNFPGTCVKYFSAPLGETVPCPISGWNNLCASGTCYNNGIDDRGTCVQAPQTLPTFPAQCTTSSQCIGYNSNLNQQFVGSCQCGFNGDAQKYCAPFPGDEPGISYIKQIAVIMTSDAMSLCQTTRRYYNDCLDMVASSLGLNSNNYFSAMMNFTNFVSYINNDQCVKTVINNDFWSRTPDGPTPPPPPPTPPHNDTGSADTLALGLALLTFFN